MPYTFGQLKSDLRALIFPAGEAPNLVRAHDKTILDALIEIQTFVECQQQNNTNLYPQCATLYNCGLTVIDSAPRGKILKVSVIDKIDPATGLENADSPDDWCSEIFYNPIDACHIHSYYRSAKRSGCCPSIPLFFGLGAGVCGKAEFPVPTDEGLPAGLPGLPLGFHYSQDSTDRTRGRARGGVWAQERGQIWVAPWIQSLETVVVKWDGIKRTWADADPIDNDPLLLRAIKCFVQKEHADEFDHEFSEGATFDVKWRDALALLVHQCREETRARECETSHARAATVTTLYYNDEQSGTAQCKDSETGSPVTVTIPAGSVGSNISVNDANQKAKDQALAQAKTQLVCIPIPVTFFNDEQTATAQCLGEEGAPPPEGLAITVTIPANTVSSIVSKADANAQALAQAQATADSQLSCLFWNAAQTFTATCPTGSTGTAVTRNVAAHTFSSTVSQADADQIALNSAKTAAEGALVCTPVGGGGPVTIFKNTPQTAQAQILIRQSGGGESGSGGVSIGIMCPVIAIFTVGANVFTSPASQAAANQQALLYAQARAAQLAAQHRLGPCGTYSGSFP